MGSSTLTRLLRLGGQDADQDAHVLLLRQGEISARHDDPTSKASNKARAEVVDRVHDHADVVAEHSIGAARLVDHHLEQRRQLRALGVRNSMLSAGVLLKRPFSLHAWMSLVERLAPATYFRTEPEQRIPAAARGTG